MKRIITILAFLTSALVTNAADLALVEGTKDSVCKLKAINLVSNVESNNGYKYQIKRDDIQQSIEENSHVFLIDVVRNPDIESIKERFMYLVKIRHTQVSQNDSKLCDLESLQKIEFLTIKPSNSR